MLTLLARSIFAFVLWVILYGEESAALGVVNLAKESSVCERVTPFAIGQPANKHNIRHVGRRGKFDIPVVETTSLDNLTMKFILGCGEVIVPWDGPIFAKVDNKITKPNVSISLPGVLNGYSGYPLVRHGDYLRQPYSQPRASQSLDLRKRRPSGQIVEYQRYEQSYSSHDTDSDLPFCRLFLPFSSRSTDFRSFSGSLLSFEVGGFMLLGLAFCFGAALCIVGVLFYADRYRKIGCAIGAVVGASGGLTFWGWVALGHPLVIWGLCQSWAA